MFVFFVCLFVLFVFNLQNSVSTLKNPIKLELKRNLILAPLIILRILFLKILYLPTNI